MSEFKYTQDPELQALAAAAREREIIHLVNDGFPRELATMFIDGVIKSYGEAFLNMIMKHGTNESSLFSLIKAKRSI